MQALMTFCHEPVRNDLAFPFVYRISVPPAIEEPRSPAQPLSLKGLAPGSFLAAFMAMRSEPGRYQNSGQSRTTPPSIGIGGGMRNFKQWTGVTFRSLTDEGLMGSRVDLAGYYRERAAIVLHRTERSKSPALKAAGLDQALLLQALASRFERAS